MDYFLAFLQTVCLGVLGLSYLHERDKREKAEESLIVAGEEFRSLQEVDTILNQINDYITFRNFNLSPEEVRHVAEEIGMAALTTKSSVAIGLALNSAKTNLLRAKAIKKENPMLDECIKKQAEAK